MKTTTRHTRKKSTDATTKVANKAARNTRINANTQVGSRGKGKVTSLAMSSLSLCIAAACYGVSGMGNLAHAGPEGAVVVSGSGRI